MRFEISYSDAFRWLATITGTGPGRSGVEVTDDHVEARMGWAFRARTPRNAIRAVEQPVEFPALFGWGVHGWNGRWSVNGSQRGAVRIAIEPAANARVLGITVTLRELYVSLEEPEAFATAVRR